VGSPGLMPFISVPRPPPRLPLKGGGLIRLALDPLISLSETFETQNIEQGILNSILQFTIHYSILDIQDFLLPSYGRIEVGSHGLFFPYIDLLSTPPPSLPLKGGVNQVCALRP
jgi:hypothetical protein